MRAVGSAPSPPAVRPAREVPEAAVLETGCEIVREIVREGEPVFAGEVPAGRLVRTPAELAGHLFRAEHFPDGQVLATGTGIVPDLDFTLRRGDVVRVAIAGSASWAIPCSAAKGRFRRAGREQ